MKPGLIVGFPLPSKTYKLYKRATIDLPFVTFETEEGGKTLFYQKKYSNLYQVPKNFCRETRTFKIPPLKVSIGEQVLTYDESSIYLIAMDNLEHVEWEIFYQINFGIENL